MERAKVMGILVNPDEHPRLFKAIENILKVEWKMRHDAGNASLYETRPQYYEVPSHFQVNKIEKALTTLTEDELEAFATGEQADKMSLRDRNPYIEEGYYLLTDILNDFPNFNALHTSATVQESVGMTDAEARRDRKSTRLNSSHVKISYAVFCLKKKKATSGAL